jgi:hypothetical protein
MISRLVVPTLGMALLLLIVASMLRADRYDAVVRAAARMDVAAVREWLDAHENVKGSGAYDVALVDAWTRATGFCRSGPPVTWKGIPFSSWRACEGGEYGTSEFYAIAWEIVRRRSDPNDAATRFFFCRHASENVDLTLKMLRRGTEVDVIGDPMGWTALVYAAHRADAKLVRLLLGRGANPNVAFAENWVDPPVTLLEYLRREARPESKKDGSPDPREYGGVLRLVKAAIDRRK